MAEDLPMQLCGRSSPVRLQWPVPALPRGQVPRGRNLVRLSHLAHALIEVAKCRLMLCCCVVYALQVVWDGVRAQDGR